MPDWLNPGLARLLITAAVALIAVLVLGNTLPTAALLTLAAATLYAVTLSFRWPSQLLRPLPQLVLDVLLISLVVALTGGTASPLIWLPLCMGGWAFSRLRHEPAQSDTQLQQQAESMQLELDYATALAQRFAGGLASLGERRVLELAVTAAVDDLGASYAYIEYFGAGHAPGDSPHPRSHKALPEGNDTLADQLETHSSLHQLMLSSLNTKQPVTVEVDIEGARHLTCAPILDGNRRNVGVLVACDLPDNQPTATALSLLVDRTQAALDSILDPPHRLLTSAAGRDPITDLPNKASLRRLLRTDMTCERRVSAIVAELRGLETLEAYWGPPASEDALREVARALSRGYQEVFSLSEERFAVLTRGDRGRTRREAYGVQRRILDAVGVADERWELRDRTSNSRNDAVPTVFKSLRCFIGFAEAVSPFSPEALLVDCEAALEEARDSPDWIAGPGRIGRNGPAGSLMYAVDYLDSPLATHMRGVADLARRIAEKLYLEHESLEAVELGALLHDIGKLSLSQDVASKDPTLLVGLDQLEIEEVPSTGERMLRGRADQELGEQVYDAIRYHREAYDGSGYPDGRANQEIPLSSRITSVADAMDDHLRQQAIEPYCLYVPIESLARGIRGDSLGALADHLLADKGTCFDPAIVEAALAVIADLEEPD